MVADVIAPHHPVAIGLEEEHVAVEGGREEGERAAATMVHGENIKVVRTRIAVEVGVLGSNPGEDLTPYLGKGGQEFVSV